MKKFLFIDTNIFIQCSFLEVEDGDTIQSLEKLLEILSVSQNYLILPEVTRLEISHRLTTKKDEISIAINKIKSETRQEYNWLGKKITKDINDSITGVLDERLRNYEKVSTKIEEIFMLKNTINIPLKPGHLSEAYKFYITKRKPFTSKNTWAHTYPPSIQSDCLNIIAIQEFLQTETGYELYFCCRDWDFFNETDNTQLHEEIIGFIKIHKFNKNLWSLLQEGFWVKFSPVDIQKFDDLSLADLFGEKNTITSDIITSTWNFSTTEVGETSENIS